MNELSIQDFLRLASEYYGQYKGFFRESVIQYLSNFNNEYRKYLLEVLVKGEKRSFGPPDIATMRGYEEELIQQITFKFPALTDNTIDTETKDWMQRHIKYLFDSLEEGDKEKLDELHLIGLKKAVEDNDEKAITEAFELEREGFNLNNVPTDYDKRFETARK
jgi:hypothetical protein